MDLFLSINNREQVLKLPVLPAEFKVNTGVKNDAYETISQGEIKLIGLSTLAAVTIDSFFPARDYPFLRDYSYTAWEYVEMIEQWKQRRLPIRLIITDTPINMACVIDGFDYGIKDGTGDIYYSLDLSEFKFVKLG